MKMPKPGKISDKYGPLESENVRVGTADAETPEAAEDDHGLAAWRKKRARGGKVDGSAPKTRLDRRARGGKVNGKGTKINIIIAPQGGGAPAGAPQMLPPGPPPGAMPPPMARPPIAPPGPPGIPPQPMPGPMRKDGGRVPHLTGGAGGGEGRMEKAKAYGKNAKGAA